jgi:hypothetical protein
MTHMKMARERGMLRAKCSLECELIRRRDFRQNQKFFFHSHRLLNIATVWITAQALINYTKSMRNILFIHLWFMSANQEKLLIIWLHHVDTNVKRFVYESNINELYK